VTPEEFEALLAHLAPDREQAGARYQELRRRLVRLFGWRLYEAPEDLADEAIDRVARRIVEGKVIRFGFAYLCGVARNVAQEKLRERQREQYLAAILAALAAPDPEPEPASEAGRRRACFYACLAGLPADQRRLILQYHQESARIASRQRLAHELGIGLNALRIRAHRVRRKLEDCCFRCLETKDEEGRRGSR